MMMIHLNYPPLSGQVYKHSIRAGHYKFANYTIFFLSSFVCLLGLYLLFCLLGAICVIAPILLFLVYISLCVLLPFCLQAVLQPSTVLSLCRVATVSSDPGTCCIPAGSVPRSPSRNRTRSMQFVLTQILLYKVYMIGLPSLSPIGLTSYDDNDDDSSYYAHP